MSPIDAKSNPESPVPDGPIPIARVVHPQPNHADSDGDGQKNSAEAAAGTDPAQPGSVIQITSITADAGGVHLHFATEQGKRYQVQTVASLESGSWVDLGTPLAPDGSGSLTASNSAAHAVARAAG